MRCKFGWHDWIYFTQYNLWRLCSRCWKKQKCLYDVQSVMPVRWVDCIHLQKNFTFKIGFKE